MAYTANKLKSQLKCRTYQHDPADATVATKIAWVEMGINFLALVTVFANAVVTFKIFAATDSSGTGAVEVAAHAAPTTADAANDQLALEVSAEQVKAALAGATHVSVELDMDNAAGVAAVTYINDLRDKKDGLTGDIIA